MRIFKALGVFASMLALTAITAGVALASILPGNKGTKITGTSGKATLQVKGGPSITCEKSKTTGEVESPELSLILITFEPNCTAAGLAANSTGDAAKTILVHVEAGACFNAAHIDHYVLFKILPLKIEVPSDSLTLLVTGDVLGKVTPIGKKAKKFTVELIQNAGLQEVGPMECVNSKGDKFKEVFLQTKVDAQVEAESGLDVEKGELEFSAEEEFMV